MYADDAPVVIFRSEEKAEWIKMPDGSLKKLSVPAEKKVRFCTPPLWFIQNMVHMPCERVS